MPSESDILLPPGVVGPSLTAAGLAAWMLSNAGREQEAAECGEIQELIDDALQRGQAAVRVPQRVAIRAVELWEASAVLAETWASRSRPKDAAKWHSQAERLRLRAKSVRTIVCARRHGAAGP